MKDTGSTIDVYLMSLPPERRELVTKLRQIVLEHLPEGYKEGMEYGMITYYVPSTLFKKPHDQEPLGYISISSSKDYVSLFMLSSYRDQDSLLRRAHKETGKKFGIGKGSLRFRHVDELPEDLIADMAAMYTPEELINVYKYNTFS